MVHLINWTLVICITWISCHATQGSESSDKGRAGSEEVRLIRDLLDRAGEYGHHLARPVKKVKDDIKIEFALSLVQIMDFDEKNQILTLNVWKHYKWLDEFQTWNASDYGGVDKVILPSDALWTPDIVLYDNMVKRDIENHKEKLRLRSNGEIEWVPYVVYKSACRVDMSNFPFDSQTCSLKFGSWSYAAKELDLVFLNNESNFRMDQMIEDVEWQISVTRAERNVRLYNCCPPEKYVDLTFHLTVSRNWGFFLKFILFPTLLLSFLVLLTFWIPPERSDRSGLGTSLLGSYMLLLILVTSISPPSDDLQFVNYICCMMGLAFVIVIYSIVMANVCNMTQPAPQWLQKLLLQSAFGRLCMCLSDKTRKETVDNGTSGNIHLMETVVTADKPDAEPKSQDATKRNPKQDWLNLVKVIDHVVFVLCALYILICLIMFFPRP